MITAEQLIQYLNYLFLATVVFYAFIGFLRGTMKSLYYLIATVLIFFAGWLAMGSILSWLRNYDLSRYNIVIQNIPLKNLNQFIEDIIIREFPAGRTLMTEDTLFKEFVYGVLTMALQLVYFIILTVLAFTIFKLIFDIIWFIIKPRKKTVNGARVKRKVSFLSRLGGMGIGVVKGTFYALLMFFPLAGITSMTDSINQALSEPQENRYQLIILSDSITVVESENQNPNDDQIKEILELLGAYEQTIAKKVLGTFKADTKLFDQFLSFKVHKSNIRLRHELEIVSNAIDKINKKTGNIGLEASIKKIIEEDSEFLKEIVDDLSKLKLIQVAIPIGIEVVLLLEDENGKTLLSQMPEGIVIDFDSLYDINYQADFKTLGYTFVDVTSLLSLTDPNKEINFLKLDPEIVERIFNNIAELEIVSEFAPIFLSYLVTLDAIKQALKEFEMIIDDLGLDEIEDWGGEIRSIGKIYKAFSQLQIENFDNPEGLKLVTEEKVNNFSEAVFSSSIITNAVPALVNTLSKTIIPENYRDVIIFDSITWNQNEFSAILNAIVVLIRSEIISGKEEALTKLSDDTIDDLAKYLSRSHFITTNLSNIMEIMLDQVNFLGGETKFVTLSQNEWTEQELRSIFKTFQFLGSAGVDNLKELTDDDIDTLATNMSSSLFITRNLNTIFKKLLSQTPLLDEGIEIKTLEADEWTKDELINIISSFRIISDAGSENLLNLPDDQINKLSYHLANSKLISRNLDVIIESAIQDIDFGEGVEIAKFERWDDEVAAEKELKALFTSTKIINQKGSDANALLDLNDDEMDTLLSSEIISLTLVNVIQVYSQEGRELDFLIGVDNENINWLDRDYQEAEFIIEDNYLLITPLPNITKYNIYCNDQYLASTRAIKYDLTGLEIENPTFKVIGINEGELRKLFVALGSVTENIDGGFTVDILSTLTDEEVENIMFSEILVLSIVNQLEILDRDQESIVTIPEGPLTSEDEKIKLSAWKNDYQLDENGNLTYNDDGTINYQKGELERTFDALQIVLAGDSIENIDIKNILDQTNQDIVLQSLVVEETIITQIEKKVAEEQMIVIPNNIRDDRSLWKGEHGELRKFLNSLNYLLGENASFNNLDFSLEQIIEHQDEILKSDVIVETAISKIESQDNVYIPEGSGYGLKDPNNRSPWKNKYLLDAENNYQYDEDGNVIVIEKGELARLLNALDLILESNLETGEKDFENINFKLNALFDSENQDVILSSLVVSETAVHIVYDTSSENENVYIPLGYVNRLDDNSEYNRDKWFNEYENNTLVARKELACLLDAAKVILGDEEDFENLQFDINIAFDEHKQETILKSYVFSESILQKIYSEALDDGTLVMPSANYVNPINDTSRDKWYNTYIDGKLHKGEIARLLDAAKALFGEDGNVSDQFVINNLFDKDKQITVLKSYVFAETIVHKILAEDTKVINVPINDLNGNPMRDPLNRAPWYNVYDQEGLQAEGEIARLLNAANKILDEGVSFSEMEFDLSKIFDQDIQETSLQSLIISESIVHKIISSDSIHTLPETDLQGRSLMDAENRIAWYNYYDENEQLVENEIAKFLKGIELILDNDQFSFLEEITIDNILALDLELEHDEEFYVVTSDFATILDSVVLENIIAPLANTIATETLGSSLVEPADGYHWYKKELIENFDPQTFKEELYDLQGFLESLYVMSQVGIKYDNLHDVDIHDDEMTQTFAKSLVISRVFKGSIAKIFNSIIGVPFFNQSDYDDLSRKDAYDTLMDQINFYKKFYLEFHSKGE